jgi:hypothetical protein
MKKFISILIVIFILFLRSLTASAENEATESAENGDPIRDAVQEKLEAALNKPKAYLGVVTDIVETTIQIKSTGGEIQQVSINEENTNFVNITSNAKAVNFSDIAIGDFLISMGFLDGNSVLAAQRVLIADEPEKPDRISIYGEVKELGNGSLVMQLKPSGESLELEPESNISVTEVIEGEAEKSRFSQIEEKSIIIAIGKLENNILEARTIQVISSPEPSPTPEKSEE